MIVVVQLLGPEDMVNPHVDELSMMTYLSQFPDAQLKPGAPIKASANPAKVSLQNLGQRLYDFRHDIIYQFKTLIILIATFFLDLPGPWLLEEWMVFLQLSF